MEIGKRVKEKRIKAGLGQGELAAQAGINPAYLWRIETARSQPSAGVLVRIADALGCSVAELAGEEVATPLTPAQKRWLGLLDLLPPARIPEAYAQVARLAAEEVGEDFPVPDDALAPAS